MTIEWTHRDNLLSADALHRAATHDADVEGQMVPVVHLSEVDAILREAVVIATAYTKQRRCYYDAMADFADDPRMTDEQIGVGEPVYMRAVKFLASVAEWREREAQQRTQCSVSFSHPAHDFCKGIPFEQARQKQEGKR